MCCSCALSAFAADAINGTVRNQTTGKAAAGDEVILLRLQNGMEEEARTRVDAAGAFSLPLVRSRCPAYCPGSASGSELRSEPERERAAGRSRFSMQFRTSAICKGTLGIAQVESDGRDAEGHGDVQHRE